MTSFLHKWTSGKRAIAILLTLTALTYINTVKNGYSVDDSLVTFNNKKVEKGWAGIGEILTTPMDANRGQSYSYRPVAVITFALEHQFFGANPGISHFINLVFYLLTVILLFFILNRLKRNPSATWPFWATLIFALHPLHNEVVNSLKNRDELLAFAVALWAFWSAIQYLEKKKWYYLLIGALAFSLAVFAKVSAVPMVFIIPLALWFTGKASLKQAVGIFFLFFAFGSLRNLWMLYQFGGQPTREYLYFENPLYFSDSLVEHIPAVFYSFFFYVKMLFWPVPLISYYGFQQVPLEGWSNPVLYLGIALLALSVGYIIKRWKKREIGVLGVAIFIAAIFPYLNLPFPAPGIVAERFAYAGVLGFSLFIAHGVTQSKGLLSRWGTLVVSIFLLMAILYNINRNQDWTDEMTLYRTDVKKADQSAKMHSLLASALFEKMQQNPSQVNQREIQEALQHFQRSVEIDTSLASSYNNIGSILYSFRKQPLKAIPYFEKAVQIEPQMATYYYNLGSAYETLGQMEQALEHFRLTVYHEPGNFFFHTALTDRLLKLKKFEEAFELNEKAHFPGQEDRLLIYMGVSSLYMNDTAAGMRYFEEALQLNPNNNTLKQQLQLLHKKVSRD